MKNARAPRKTKKQAKGKPGRPRLAFDQKVADRICGALSEGVSLRRVCKTAGVPGRKIVRKWLDENVLFSAQYARARKQGIEHHIEEIIDLADTATPENAHVVRLRVDTRKWLASKVLPKVYGDRLEVGGELEVSREIDIREIARGLAYLVMSGSSRLSEPAAVVLPAPTKQGGNTHAIAESVVISESTKRSTETAPVSEVVLDAIDRGEYGAQLERQRAGLPQDDAAGERSLAAEEREIRHGGIDSQTGEPTRRDKVVRIWPRQGWRRG